MKSYYAVLAENRKSCGAQGYNMLVVTDGSRLTCAINGKYCPWSVAKLPPFTRDALVSRLEAHEGGILSFRQKVESPGLSKRRLCAFDWPKRRSACLGLSSFWRNDHNMTTQHPCNEGTCTLVTGRAFPESTRNSSCRRRSGFPTTGGPKG